MRVLPGGAARTPVLPWTLTAGSLGLVAVALLTAAPLAAVTPLVAILAAAVVGYRTLLSWRSLLAAVVVVILTIPIRRYTIPAGLPIQLEPYRVLVGLVTVAWLASMLVDVRVRLRPTGLEAPLVAVLATVLLSIVVNGTRIQELGVNQEVIKKTTFFMSFALVVYVIASVARGFEDVEFLTKLLVFGGAVVALCAIVEARTGFNVFTRIAGSFLQENYIPDAEQGLVRGAHRRAIASAQHPIALGAALAMIVPLSVYLGKQHSRKWFAATILLAFATSSTQSRTAMLMLFVIALVYLWLRPRETRRLWPALIPVAVLMHAALPGAIGSIAAAFHPEGGLVAQQQNANVGSGRIATLGPSLDSEFKPRPLLGGGFGTRVVNETPDSPPILDDQWLGNLLETGLLGALAWAWLYVRAIRRFRRGAREDTPRGWLFVALTASVVAYVLGMATYDSYSFIQVTFLLFIVLGLGCALSAAERQRAA
jgi:hypothetical protein